MVSKHEDKSFMTDAWEEFAAKVIPQLKPTHIQYIDMQSTFYAGALQIMSLCEALGEEAADQDEANAILTSIHDELEDFFKQRITRWKPSSN